MTLSKAANWTLKLACVMPFAYWVAGVFLGWLGVEPLVKINTQSGYVVLVFLLLNAAIGAVHALKIIKFEYYRFLYSSRRFWGIFCGFYLILHFTTYLAKESFLPKAWEQIATKNYLIAATFSAVIILILMLTSNNFSVRKLKSNWKKLHNSVHLANFVVLFHIFLIEKANLVLLALLVLPVAGLQLIRLVRRVVKNEIH